MADASILLNGLRPTTGRSSIAEAMGLVQGAIDAPNQSRLLGEQVTGAGLDNEYAGMRNQYAPDHFRLANESAQQTMDKTEAERILKSAAQDAFTVGSMLESGNIPRAKVALADRIKNIFNRGGDPSDSIEIMRMLEAGDVDGVKSELKNVVDLGVKSGLFGVDKDAPSSLQEWNAYNSMTPEDQKRYLEMRRGDPYELAAYRSALDLQYKPQTAAAVVAAEQGVKQSDPLYKSQVNQAETKAAADAMALEQTQVANNEAIAAGQDYLALIDTMLKHPGRQAATGASSIFPSMRGGSAKDYDKKFGQLQAANFMAIIQKMRGLGTLSEQEGKTATAAVSDVSLEQSESEHEKSLKILRRVVERGIRNKPGTYAASKERATQSSTETPVNIDDLVNKYAD